MFVDQIGPCDGPWLLNPGHPLNTGRVAWWLVTPSNYGQGIWSDLVSSIPGKLTGFTSGYGWSPLSYPGGSGSISFLGTNSGSTSSQYIDAGRQLIPTAGAGTFAGWIYPINEASHIENCLMSQGQDGSGNGWNMALWLEITLGAITSANFAVVATSGGAAQVKATITVSSLALNNWYFLAGAWSPGVGVSVYLGNLNVQTFQSATTATAKTTLRTSTVGTRIGDTPTSSILNLNGNATDLSVYNWPVTSNLLSAAFQLGPQSYPGVLRRRRRVAYSVPAASGVPFGGYEDGLTTLVEHYW